MRATGAVLVAYSRSLPRRAEGLLCPDARVTGANRSSLNQLGKARTLDYDGNRIYACEVLDFEDGKIKRARAYFAEPFEAPQWRAQWVERM